MVGDTKMSALSLDHMGWLICDGRTFYKSEFPFLFDVIGYSFGGSGDSFVLPNPAGCVPGFIGTGVYPINGANLGPTPRELGDLLGQETHILTMPELATHNHGVEATGGSNTSDNTTIPWIDPGHTHAGTTNAAGFGTSTQNITSVAGGGGDHIDAADNTGNHTHTFTTNSSQTGLTDPGHHHVINPSGSNLPHNNMQPTIFLGNLFMYSGKPFYGTNPFCALTPLGAPTNIV
jgi:microcystin-dependent protein